MAVRRAIPTLGHGQVWWADLSGEKIRPVVILTRRRVAGKLTRVLVAPVTSTVRQIASEVPVGPAEGLVLGSVANLDNIQLIEVDRLLEQIGSISQDRWPEFCQAMGKVMGC